MTDLAITPVAPGPLKGGRLTWSREELDILTAHYRQGGALACGRYLPHRPPNTIHARAARLGIRRLSGYHFQPPSDARTDAAITQLYAKGAPPPGAMRDLCLRLQRPRQWVRAQAVRLGVIRHTRGRNWTAPEDAILKDREGKGPRTMQKALIAAGYTDRSEPAIYERCRKLAISGIVDRAGHYGADEIARLLGQDIRVVSRWLNSGKLKGQAKREASGRVTAYHVKHQALRTFLIDYPLEWTPARVDRFWLIDILAGRVGPRTYG